MKESRSAVKNMIKVNTCETSEVKLGMVESLKSFVTEFRDGPTPGKVPYPGRHKFFYKIMHGQMLRALGEDLKCHLLRGLQLYIGDAVPVHLFALGHEKLLLVHLVVEPSLRLVLQPFVFVCHDWRGQAGAISKVYAAIMGFTLHDRCENRLRLVMEPMGCSERP